MTEKDKKLLEALSAHLNGGRVDWNDPMTGADWGALFALTREQHVLPMVLEAVYPCPAFQSLPEQVRTTLKQESRRRVIGQTLATQTILRLVGAMEGAGLHPLIMKGAACRSTYPVPDLRPSSDEDILVPAEEFSRCAAFLLDYGCQQTVAGEAERDFELSFHTPEGLHIELHRTPFAPDSDTLSGCNPLFEGAWARGMELEGFRTMSPHDHMLYLILHAFKHLIHSGFGIRQVCDILLWGEKYKEKIDWKELERQCRTVRAWGFLQGIFRIGQKWLSLPVPAPLGGAEGLGDALLEDLLSGGVFGGTDLSRKHSSTVTLNAVEGQQRGKRPSLLPTLFPKRSAMERQYPYVAKCPLLLPVAWIHRMVRYGGEKKDDTNRAADSLRIGKARIALLKELGVLDE